jgi:TRAP-type C4-dicarboxylate transport system permease small subunit
MRRILVLIDDIGRYSAYLAAMLVVGIAVLILAEIFSRNVLNISLSFSFEFSAYFMATAIFLAAAFTMRTGGHVRVSILSSAVPPQVARLVDVVATIIGTVLAIILAYAMISFAWKAGITGRTSATIDETPLVIPQGIMAFGALMLALQMIARVIRMIMGDEVEDQEARKTYGVE